MSETVAHGGLIRTLAPAEALAAAGEWRTSGNETMMGTIAIAAVIALAGYLASAAFGMSVAGRVTTAIVAGAIAIVFSLMEAQTVFVISPDGVMRRNPLPFLSRTIPFLSIRSIELWHGRAHVVRIRTIDDRVVRFPVQRELWNRLLRA